MCPRNQIGLLTTSWDGDSPTLVSSMGRLHRTQFSGTVWDGGLSNRLQFGASRIEVGRCDRLRARWGRPKLRNQNPRSASTMNPKLFIGKHCLLFTNFIVCCSPLAMEANEFGLLNILEAIPRVWRLRLGPSLLSRR